MMTQMFGNGNKDHPSHCGVGIKEAGATAMFQARGSSYMYTIEGMHVEIR